jgi:homotetrameric cytidine deaminase
MSKLTWKILGDRSYTPYSKHVEMAVCVGKNRCYPGVRIENIAFPDSIDAVRAAVSDCLGSGDVPQKIITTPGSSIVSLNHWIDLLNVEHSEQDDISDLHVESPAMELLDDEILPTLTALIPMAVTPASDFPVSALLDTDKGTFPGVNVEVQDWAYGLCAERLALSRAISYGATKLNSIYVHAPKSEYSSPCGSCRQVLNEHLGKDSMITMHHGDHTSSEMKFKAMLPYSFQSTHLLNK